MMKKLFAAIFSAVLLLPCFIVYGQNTNPLIGETLTFESTDLDGNTVKSEDLFKDNKITMVNLWGTWCPYCLLEMEDLAGIHNSLQEKGCGVVGIEYEPQPLEAFAENARAIMAEAGTNYPNVLMPKSNAVLASFMAYPTTIFVDSEGRILAAPIEGAQVDKYEPAVDELLATGDFYEVSDAAAAANGGNAYCVYVYDQEGSPVEDVLIQFCDDTSCSFQSTDAEGAAVFNTAQEKVYEVHVLKVPKGFLENDEEYKTLDVYSDVTISLERDK